jgi:hypothetical protein
MPSRPAIALLVVGLLLLPGPVYAAAVESVDTDRVSSGYHAERIDLADPEVRAELVEQFSWRMTVFPSHVADGSSRYNAPDRTAAVLRRAYRTNDSVRVTDEAVRADLVLLDAEADFVALDADNGPRRLVVDRSDDAAVVSITPVPTAVRFEMVRDEIVVRYESLPPAERDTVDRVLRTTGDEDAYYRPYEDEPHPFPAVVEKDGEHYLVRSVITVDDFGTDGRFAGLVASGIGVVCLLAGGAVALVGRLGAE